MQYEKVAKWLSRKAVDEYDLMNSNFTYGELQFLIGFNRQRLAKKHSRLLEYF